MYTHRFYVTDRNTTASNICRKFRACHQLTFTINSQDLWYPMWCKSDM